MKKLEEKIDGLFVCVCVFFTMFVSAVARQAQRHNRVLKLAAAIALVYFYYPAAQSGGPNSMLLGVIAIGGLAYIIVFVVRYALSSGPPLQELEYVDHKAISPDQDNWLRH